jgi:hypothetical protein
MPRTMLSALVVVGLCATSACASSPPPQARAASVERVQCEPTATGSDTDRLIRSTTVIAVEPIYSDIITSNTSEKRVAGAKLVVRPPPGVTADEMTRLLQCHSARVLLGQVSGSAITNDPYWLADTWVDIQVTPEDGNFAITLSADSVRDNLKVYGRASRYADDHALATEPGLP